MRGIGRREMGWSEIADDVARGFTETTRKRALRGLTLILCRRAIMLLSACMLSLRGGGTTGP